MNPGRNTSVLLADRAADMRTLLAAALDAPGFTRLASVARASEIAARCRALRPDVVVLDPEMDDGLGYTAIEEIMAFRPTPILVLGAPEGSFRALSLGALDVLARPAPGMLLRGAPEQAFGAALRERLRTLAAIRVITHVRGRRASRSRPERPPQVRGFAVVGIAASLGGPRAVADLLRDLPRELPAPVLIVQHITEGFTGGLVAWLAAETGHAVREAREGEPVVPGVVLVAPCGFHLGVDERDRVTLRGGAPVDGFRPSGTMLFRSLAARYGPRVVGVVLTGMGRDGAAGLAAIRDAGGTTLAQDAESSAVYGMPKAAVNAGAVQEVLPLERMAGRIEELVRMRAVQ